MNTQFNYKMEQAKEGELAKFTFLEGPLKDITVTTMNIEGDDENDELLLTFQVEDQHEELVKANEELLMITYIDIIKKFLDATKST